VSTSLIGPSRRSESLDAARSRRRLVEDVLHAEDQQLATILDRVRRLEIKTRRLVDALFAGEYRSAFKGRGLEFKDIREYDPGDDFRLIDWRVTARTGSPHVRQYEEERELTILVCLDVSPSSDFGSVRAFKRELAVEFAAFVGFSAVHSNDRFGGLLFTDRVEAFVGPRKGRRHVLRILRDAMAVRPEGRGTRIASAMRYARDAMRKRCVMFVVSDFLDDDFVHDLKLTSLRHDVIAVELTDRREREMPDVGVVEFVDPETGRRMFIDTSSRRSRELFAVSAHAARQRRLKGIRSAGVDVLSLRTDEDVLVPMLRFFRARQRQRGR